MKGPLESDSDLWEVLGASRPVSVRGSFADDVLRAVRRDSGRGAADLPGLWLAWAAPVLLMVVFAGGGLLSLPSGSSDMVVDPFAEAAGFDEVLGVEYHLVAGPLTARS